MNRGMGKIKSKFDLKGSRLIVGLDRLVEREIERKRERVKAEEKSEES